MTAHDPISSAVQNTGQLIGYARLMDVDGDIKWVLFLDEGATETDGEGMSEPIFIAAHRQSCASYAHSHDIALLTVH